MTYARKVAELATTDPPTFICHYYNFYFAHTAGGRMIGKKMSELLLDSATLKFYQWEGDVQVHLDRVRKVGVLECVGGGRGVRFISVVSSSVEIEAHGFLWTPKTANIRDSCQPRKA